MNEKSLDKTVIYVCRSEEQAAQGLAMLMELRKKGDKAKKPMFPAIDFETTGLKPTDEGARIRLTSLHMEGITVIIDHMYAGAFHLYADALICAAGGRNKVLYVFNNTFEGRWFEHVSPTVRYELVDVGALRKAKLGGAPLSLADMVFRDLGVRLSKEMQVSDWSAPDLSKKQLVYAAKDAYYTSKLAELWMSDLNEKQLEGAILLNDVWKAVVEMEDNGMLLDERHHKKLIKMWGRRRDVAERCIRKFVPVEALENIRSKKQLSALITLSLDSNSLELWPKTTKSGQLQTDRKTLNQFSMMTPYPFSRFLAALMVFNRADKYLGTYGEKLLNCQHMAGRIYCRFNIAQAVTGRFSSSGAMNAQNYPRLPLVRRSFIAPKGSKLVMADYSGIELRVLAEMSGDEQLKQDVIYGNVHAESACAIFRLDRDDFFTRLENKDSKAKELRSKAKAFSFQLTYGAGVAALSLTLRCSVEEADDYMKRWGQRYPKAYHFRNIQFERMMASGFLECKSGRTIYVHKNDRTLPVASNYPIQGSAADVMYAALIILKRELDVRRNGKNVFDCNKVKMLATVHDEILLEVKAPYARRAQNLLETCMKAGWLDVFPDTETDNLIESAIGDTWAAKA